MSTWMTDQPTAQRGPCADIAPALDDLTQRVLFGEVGKRPGSREVLA